VLDDYRFDTATGRWRHRDGIVTPPLSLREVSYAGGRASMPTNDATGGEDLLVDHLREGAAILAAASGPDLDEHPGAVSADFEHLRWFDLPPRCLRPA
jgi:hypothetical protein